MNTFFIIVVLFGFVRFILYIIKNNSNPNEKNVVLNEYNFSKDKNKVRFNHYKPEEHLIFDIDDNSEDLIIEVHFSAESKNIYQLISRDYSYFIQIYDSELILLNEINLKLIHFSEYAKTSIKTIKDNDIEIIILSICTSENISYYQFNLYGVNIYKKHFSETNGEIILIYHNENEFTSVSKEDYIDKPLKTFWIEDETLFNMEFTDDALYPEKEWSSYEYIECVTQTNKPNQLAFLSIHANYGVQGVKIFELNKSNNLNLIYDMDDLDFDGAFHNLTFNSRGDKFVVLLYESDKLFTDYFSICEYSVLNDKKPIRIIKTKLGYLESSELSTYYITDKLLCIIRDSDLIIYDLELGKVKETRKRDLRSAYYAGFNIIIYHYKTKMLILKYDLV